MHNATPDVKPVVRELYDHWIQRKKDFPVYLRDNYGYELEDSWAPGRLIIIEMADGDIDRDNIGRDALAKWFAEDSGIIQVPRELEAKVMFDTISQSSKVYKSPSYLFFARGNKVLLSERYGRGLMQRQLGTWDDSREPHIEWTLLWGFRRKDVS